MADIKEVLRRLLTELDKDEQTELLESLKGKKLTGEELVAAIKELPPDARKEVREALAEVKEEIEEEKDEKKEKESPTDDGKEKPKEIKDGKGKTRTRPGRKSNRAYDWTIGEDGEVERLTIARVYTGPDELDEVEMLPVEDEGEEEETETDDGKKDEE